MANDYVDITGHRTGRILNKRDPYHVDLKAIFEDAAKKKIGLEIGALPDRLDLSDKNCIEVLM